MSIKIKFDSENVYELIPIQTHQFTLQGAKPPLPECDFKPFSVMDTGSEVALNNYVYPAIKLNMNQYYAYKLIQQLK